MFPAGLIFLYYLFLPVYVPPGSSRRVPTPPPPRYRIFFAVHVCMYSSSLCVSLFFVFSCTLQLNVFFFSWGEMIFLCARSYVPTSSHIIILIMILILLVVVFLVTRYVTDLCWSAPWSSLTKWGRGDAGTLRFCALERDTGHGGDLLGAQCS